VRRIARLPKILKDKIRVAELIRRCWTVVGRIDEPTHRYYWSGTFKDPKSDLVVYIYFQRYVNWSRRMQVHYIHIRENSNNKALGVKQIRDLLVSFL